MMLIAVAVIGLLAVSYCVLMLSAAIGLRRVLRCKYSESADLPTVSVVVPARNEQSTIEECVSRVLANDYPADKLQLIVVDDGSSDGTFELLSKLAVAESATNRRLIVLRMPGEGSGKHDALNAGIAASVSDIVVTTDADCLVGTRWVRSMIAPFESDVGFVAGPVVNNLGHEPKQNLESLEFLSLVGFGAGTIGIGMPTICNSANAAYRRALLVSWQRNSRHPRTPAADELLMHFVHSQTPYRVRFAAGLDAVVRTKGTSSLSQFWTQRSRWASSVPFFPVRVVGLAAMVFAFYLAVPVALVLSLWSPVVLTAIILGLIMKLVADSAVVVPVCRHFGRRALLRYFVAAEVLHIPYIVVAVALGILGRPRWKGRPLASDDRERQQASEPTITEESEWSVEKAV